jgi:hypothetical protein
LLSCPGQGANEKNNIPAAAQSADSPDWLQLNYFVLWLQSGVNTFKVALGYRGFKLPDEPYK